MIKMFRKKIPTTTKIFKLKKKTKYVRKRGNNFKKKKNKKKVATNAFFIFQAFFYFPLSSTTTEHAQVSNTPQSFEQATPIDTTTTSYL